MKNGHSKVIVVICPLRKQGCLGVSALIIGNAVYKSPPAEFVLSVIRSGYADTLEAICENCQEVTS